MLDFIIGVLFPHVHFIKFDEKSRVRVVAHHVVEVETEEKAEKPCQSEPQVHGHYMILLMTSC